MKKIPSLILIALPLVAGCVASSADNARYSEAYARCSYAPGPEEREKCIKAQIGLLEVRDEEDAEAAEAEKPSE